MKILFFLSMIYASVIPNCGVSTCDEEVMAKVRKVKCETTDDCISKFDKTYICAETRDYYYKKKLNNDCEVITTPNGKFCKIAIPPKQCVKNLCETENINCGFGTCEIKVGYELGVGYPICNCEEGYLNKLNYETNRESCIENSCNDSEYCENTELRTESTEEYYDFDKIKTPVCSAEGKCANTCINHFDCKGEKEYCLDGYECVDLDKIECDEGDYVYPYSKNNRNKYEDYKKDFFCYNNCSEENPCDAGFICNSEKKCVPKCINDEQCKLDKFQSDVCDTQLHYCK